MFYLIVSIIISYILCTIFFFFKKKALFPMKPVYVWIFFKQTIVFVSIYIYLYLMGVIQPWLYEEDLSSLTSENGTLMVRWEGNSNKYYIKRFDETETKFKFNLANILRVNNLENYNGKDVILRHKNRYVYQMENDKGEIAFSIESANTAVCAYNQMQAFIYILLISGWILATMSSIYKKKGDKDGD